MKKLLTLLALCCLMVTGAWAQASASTQKAAAEEVIRNFMGAGSSLTVNVTIDPSIKVNGKDKFTYTLSGSTLNITASNGVSACRGFYDFTKSNGAGICSWSGNRFDSQAALSGSTPSKEITSPYRDHQYFNVVTYGYTTPYWDEARWDKEIEWMALHGIDMPLMLVGSENIYRKVFKEKYNLSDDDLNAWEVGPANLPWFRMGNLSGRKFGGPLGQHWHERQEALAKHILARMRNLGMKPVCPAFGGFVPEAMKSKVQGVENVGWGWCKDGGAPNYRLSPSTDAFVEIGTAFIQEWEKTYGACKYYLSDSFNEMKVPSDLSVLTQYGKNVFKCIDDGSATEDAVWVTQGWTFVYQSGEWGKDKFNALTAEVPANRFNMLYMSPEYGNGKWNDPYQGFNGKEWTITMLPNMGGKNFWNGSLDNYAGSYRKQYTGGNCNNLIGWGMTPEGVENNEIIYEMICDAGWTPTTQEINVSDWKQQYASGRYGTQSDDVKDFLNTLHSTVLKGYQDHKCFGWQGYNKTSGYINGSIDPGNTFYEGMETFLSADNLEKYRTNCPKLLRYDIIEAAAFYAGCRVEKLNKRIKIANAAGDKDEAHQLVSDLQTLMKKMDRVLTAHPIYDEQKWEDKAVAMAGANSQGTVSAADAATRAEYVKNARTIVSVWHGDHGTAANSHEPVNDYACRTWAGLIRDYYLPRLVAEWGNNIDNAGNNLRDIEHTFINASALSSVEGGALSDATSDDDLMTAIVDLMEFAQEAGDINFEHVTTIQPSTDTENHWYAIRNAGQNFNLRVMTATGSDLSASATGNLVANEFDGNTNQFWRFIDNGDGTYRIEGRSGQSMTYSNKPSTSLMNIGTDITMVLHGKVGVDSKSTAENQDCWHIIPAAANNANNAYHMNASQGLMVWNHTLNGSYVTDTSWSIEEVTAIGETYTEDYARYAKLLNGFNNWGDASLIGQTGQPKTNSSIATALSTLGEYTAGLHETYDDFLAKWHDNILAPNVEIPTSAPKLKLFNLLLSIYQTIAPSTTSTEANEALKEALVEAQGVIANGADSDCAAQFGKIKTAVDAFFASTLPVKVTSTSKIAAGNKYMLKNISSARNACLVEKSDGELRILEDVTSQANADAGYYFTLEASENGKFKIKTASGKYIPVITAVTPNSEGSKCTSNATGDSFTFNYVSGDTPYWTIAATSGNYLYNFGPSYNSGRLLLGTNAKITDGGMWELYLVYENPVEPSEGDWTASDWTACTATTTTNFKAAAYYDAKQITIGSASTRRQVRAKAAEQGTNTVTVTVKFSSGTHAQALYGVQLLNEDGTVAAETAYELFSLGTGATKTYTLSNVPDGTYTVRVWSAATNGDETMTATGTFAISVNDAQVGETQNWDNTNWNIENTNVPTGMPETPSVGKALNQGSGQTRTYYYMDKQMTFDKATTLTTTITNEDNTTDLDLIGVELLKSGTLVTTEGSYDGHYSDGETNNAYTVQVPEAGDYTVRTWASYVPAKVPANGGANYAAEEPAPVGNPATEVHVTFSNTGTSWEGVTFNVAAKDKDANDIEGVTVSEATGTVNPKTISIGNDNIGLNYQTSTSPGTATVTFTITGVPAGSSFNTVSLPLYSVKASGAHQNGSKKEVNVALSVSGGVTTAFNDTKNNFDINATPGNLNEALVFTTNDPIVATGAPITVSFTFSKGDTNEGCYMALHSLNLTTYVEPAKTFDATKVYTIHEPDDSRGYMAYNPANNDFVGLADVTLNGCQNKHAKTETSGEDITHWNIIEEPAGTVKLYNIQHEKYLGLNGSNQAIWVEETDAATFTYTTENDGETYLFQSTKTASNNYLNPTCGYEANNGPVRLGSKENTSDWTIAEVVTPTLQDRHLYTIKGEFSDGTFAPVVCESNLIKGGANGVTPETFVFFETTHTNDAGLTPVFNLGTVEGNGYFNYNAKGNANVNKANAAAVAFPTSKTTLPDGWSFSNGGFKEGYYGMVGLNGTNAFRTYVVKPSANIDYNTKHSSDKAIVASNSLGATSAWCYNYVIEEVKGYTVYDIVVSTGNATVSYNGETGNCLTTVAQSNGGYIVLKNGVTPSESNLTVNGVTAGYTASVSVEGNVITISETPSSPEAVITAPIDYNPLNGSGSVWSTWQTAVGETVPEGISNLHNDYFTAANLRVIEKVYNEFPAGKYLQSTFQYSTGNNRTDIVGVEILKDGNVVFSDYHFGWTGSSGTKLDNVYVLGPVAETGTYTVRYISSVQSAGGEKNVNTNGTITNALLNTGTYTVHITNSDMVTSGTPQVTYKGAKYSENDQFIAPSGTVKVGDIDSAHDYLGVNVEIAETATDTYTINATYVPLYHPTWRTDGIEGHEGVTHPLKTDGTTKYMIFDTSTQGADDWAGFMYPNGNKVGKTSPCTPLEYKGPEIMLWTVEPAEGVETGDGYYLKNVATGKYYDGYGNPHDSKETSAIVYIQDFRYATMAKADSTTHSVNRYEEPIVDINDDKGCWVIGAERDPRPRGTAGPCWNGPKAGFTAWWCSSPFAFYEICELENNLENTPEIRDVLIDYCKYFEGENDDSHDYRTYQEKVEDATDLELSGSFTDYVAILREEKDMTVKYPQPVEIDGQKYGRFITVRNAVNLDYLKGNSVSMDRAVMWLNADNELVSYDTGLGYSGTDAATAIAGGKSFTEQTLSDVSPKRGTLVVKTSDNKYLASSGDREHGTSYTSKTEATTTNATTWYVDNADYVVATIPASGYTTFYAPVPMEVPDGVEAYIIKADEGTDETGLNICTLTLTEIGFIPAQTAVVLAGEQGAVKLDVMYGTYGSESEKRVRADEDSYWVFPEFNEYVAATNVLKGYDYTCTNQQTSTSDGVDGKFIYTLSNGKFQYYTGATIKAFKCFLELTQDYRAGHNRAATNPFRIIINGETEGISGTKTSSDNNAFDLSGRRINVQSERGLYILNGKKVIR